MLASQILHTGFPVVRLVDKVSFALQLMDEYDVQHLCVINEDHFVGMVAKSDLLDFGDDGIIASLEPYWIPLSIKGEAHFLEALKMASERELSLVPVVNEQLELLGVITTSVLLHQLSRFVGTEEKGGLIVLEISTRNYSFGEISRLVETNDALITQCNTFIESETGFVIITLKVNKMEVSAIVATFQRYDYVVRYYFGEEAFLNELKDNYNHLLAYLNV